MIAGLKYRKTIFTTFSLIAIIVLAETCVDNHPDKQETLPSSSAPSAAPAAQPNSTQPVSTPPNSAPPNSTPPDSAQPNSTPPNTASASAYTDYAGPDKCVTCHKDISRSFFHTAHYRSTQPASAASILGSFEKGKNIYRYDSLHLVAMEKRADGFYQVGYLEGQERIARRIDIVVGSGTKGQTYITRNNNELYQLPVSYFTIAHQWANSPLYPRSPILFNRPISSRCLECHTTFLKQLTFSNDRPETFDPGQVVYGVSCEKCHGPAAKHVAFHTQHPGEKTARFIIGAIGFSRQQQLDLCALCHGGHLQKTRPSFSYLPGKPLSDYFTVDTSRPNPATIDVHGNQYGLLRSSKCFQLSGTLTCISCHDPHRNERTDMAAFSKRCMNCHSPGHDNVCKLTASIGPGISANCIDCHMPLRPSQSITELLPGNSTPTAAMIRSHLITIYPEQTKDFLSKNKKK